MAQRAEGPTQVFEGLVARIKLARAHDGRTGNQLGVCPTMVSMELIEPAFLIRDAFEFIPASIPCYGKCIPGC
jgi:hypothetical protein